MYIDLASVKQELNITVTTEDALLTGYITTAQRIIESQAPLGTGRVFEAAADTTRYADAPQTQNIYDYDGPNYNLLLHDIGDICSITSVVNGDGTTVSASSYTTDPRYKTPFWAIKLKRYSGVVWTYSSTAEASIAITGRWAYSTTAPADISRAALRIVVWMYRGKDNAGADQAVQTDQGIILPTNLPADVAAILAGYRSIV
jgi:Phage gp6-like head-tail connector protein